MRTSTAFGVDIGGSGIKGAVVDLEKGDLAAERVKYLTPNPSTPEPVAAVVARLVKEAEWTGELGATF
ncbi:polyphosphate--glucose phosphotransferase, partial [Kribbella sp. CWNU-51]